MTISHDATSLQKKLDFFPETYERAEAVPTLEISSSTFYTLARTETTCLSDSDGGRHAIGRYPSRHVR
jgi:hypothetical protein